VFKRPEVSSTTVEMKWSRRWKDNGREEARE